MISNKSIATCLNIIAMHVGDYHNFLYVAIATHYFSVLFQIVSFLRDTPRAITIGVPAGME